MVAVAKEEMRAAGHAPAAGSTLFDGCTVTIIKVAQIQTVPACCATYGPLTTMVDLASKVSDCSEAPGVSLMLLNRGWNWWAQHM